MWPFSKKWSAPQPQLGMMVALCRQELPPLLIVANPTGEGGAVAGMAGPANETPSAENMTQPMKEGQYIAISPGGAQFSLQIERADARAGEPLSLEPAMMEASGLTEETLAKFNAPVWRAILMLGPGPKDIGEAVAFATSLARRLATLGDGIVMDICAYRFFGPEGWPVEAPRPDFDAREHVHIHVEMAEDPDRDGCWFHTHGLLKFGRPELEIYQVPQAHSDTAYGTLLDLAQYVITTAIIEPGQTCGDPNQPFYAREGTRNREGHWEDRSVLELVDLDERRRPVPAGATRALEAFAAAP